MDFDVVCLLFTRMLCDPILPTKRGLIPFGLFRLCLISLGKDRNPTSSFNLKAYGFCDWLKKANKGQFIFMPYNP